MKFQCYLGIDIAKLSFDFALIDSNGTVLDQGQILNNSTAIRDWISQLKAQHQIEWEKTLICMEHSGYYNFHLLNTLNQQKISNIWVESPLQIKRSGGLQRGKDDAIDALRIAAYALDFQRKARLWKPRRHNLERLALLVAHRDRMVKNLMSIRNTLNEEENFVEHTLHLEMKQITLPAIQAIQQAIDQFDHQINQLLQQDSQLDRQNQIIQSIPGFGQVIAAKIIITTQGFSRLNNPRSLACFAGIAPFPHRSGTSIRGKNRVSHLANKEIKKMLHLAALVTIRKGNIMYQFYQRKIAQGKNKMSTINAIRNKLLHILLACIRNDTMYQKNYHHSLD